MPTFKLRRGESVDVASRNPVLAAGEIGFEIDTGLFKIGDGGTRYNDLPYFVHTGVLREMIEAAIADAPGGDQALYDHVHSLTPHPAYDEGPSLVLLYANAKV